MHSKDFFNEEDGSNVAIASSSVEDNSFNLEALTIEHIEKMLPYLDKNIVLPIIVFLMNNPAFDGGALLLKVLNILHDTALVEIAENVANTLTELGYPYPDLSAVVAKRVKIDYALENVDPVITKIIRFLESNEFLERTSSVEMNPRETAQFVSMNCKIHISLLDKFLDYGKLLHAQGNTDFAIKIFAEYISFYTNPAKAIEAVWGMLVGYIQTSRLEESHAVLTLLMNLVEDYNFSSPGQKLQQYVWILHSSLYVYAGVSGGMEMQLEHFMRPGYFSALETACPWLIRYLAAAALLSGKNIKEVAQLCTQEKDLLSQDPLCMLMEHLFVSFVSVEELGSIYRRVEAVLRTDKFLAVHYEELCVAFQSAISAEMGRLFTRLSLDEYLSCMGVDSVDDFVFYLNNDCKLVHEQKKEHEHVQEVDQDQDQDQDQNQEQGLEKAPESVNETITVTKIDPNATVLTSTLLGVKIHLDTKEVHFTGSQISRKNLQDKLDKLVGRTKEIMGSFYKRAEFSGPTAKAPVSVAEIQELGIQIERQQQLVAATDGSSTINAGDHQKALESY